MLASKYVAFMRSCARSGKARELTEGMCIAEEDVKCLNSDPEESGKQCLLLYATCFTYTLKVILPPCLVSWLSCQEVMPLFKAEDPQWLASRKPPLCMFNLVQETVSID